MSNQSAMDLATTQPLTDPRLAREQARWPLAGLTAVLTMSALLPLPGTDHRIVHLPSICPFYTATGLPCPGCGLTRGFVCFAHARFHESLHWHPLAPLLFTAAVLLWLEFGMRVLRGRSLFQMPSRVRTVLWWMFGFVFVGTGIARMVYLSATHTRFW